ncbi:TrbC/VirB2 family protein [Acidithiobacillus ferruginosus]|jgi:type IV secretory pathway VirB2 component (pilin)|uniref:TrbC/VirB2 family protein n=1 Tax=Acidithiobacillus ferruginosus TaxID=3063951 RepID=A0ACD5IE43_9PROT|nr:TrbC/VirB2 family protein [Acidithiobacillus ferruginosus]MBU2815092.1 hypothetical protein [Acidithiobacillus ferruginosus]
MKKFIQQFAGNVAKIAAVTAAGVGSAFANTAGGNMPWDGPLSKIYADTHGPLASTLIGLATVVAGGIWIKGEHGKAMHTVLGVVAGGGMMVEGGNFATDVGLVGATIGGHLPLLTIALHAAGL